MKFQFKVQKFQTDAVNSIVNVFKGQPKHNNERYRRDVGREHHLSEDEKISRRGYLPVSYINLSDDEKHDIEDGYEAAFRNHEVVLSQYDVLKNIRHVQDENNIANSAALSAGLGTVSLDVEMETGTGKTYVYIKTIFELHQQYGWSKFIVVVPSIAIREGVKKTFEVTQEHFMQQYGIKARFFVYSSSNLHKLDEFSQNSGINVMIINTHAFNSSFNEEKNTEGRGGDKTARIIYDKRDDFGSRRPIDVIKANRPIIILDEPQKMEGEKTQNALKKNFAPLFSLNFSATHKTKHNLIYVLDALDAFQKKLVKKIEVKGFELKNLTGTHGYMYVSNIIVSPNKSPRARIEIEQGRKESAPSRIMKLFDTGDSIYTASNNLEQYRGISISEIDPHNAAVSFTNGEVLKIGDAVGDVYESDIRRIQIRETILSHFEKEESLFDQGIKCLSLFFIDQVKNYRQYDDDGNELLGEYGKIFEEEYQTALDERLAQIPTPYSDYLRKIDVVKTHQGYFSIDKGRVTDSKTKRGSSESDDISAYDLILKNKELLLSFDEPTRFIFSHSALREGWDNPNVFQICTLKNSDSISGKRQEVGRGMRLSVNALGVRQDVDMLGENYVHGLNKLTVIASESYAKFVTELQSEIKADLYERPQKVSFEYFNGKYVRSDVDSRHLTSGDATAIYYYLVKNDYIDDDGKITEVYRDAAESGRLAALKPELQSYSESIHKYVQAIFNPSVLDDMIIDGHQTKITENPINENWNDFIELWNKINKKYAYTVSFDSDELIEKSVASINDELNVAKLSYTLTVGNQDGADFVAQGSKTKILNRSPGSFAKYDLIGKVAEKTKLTRKTVSMILRKMNPDKLIKFKENPEEFIARASKLINNQNASIVVDHIAYAPSAEQPYTQDIFNVSRASDAYNKAFKAKKSIQDYIFTDGSFENSVEQRFAKDADIDAAVVVYAKLPRGPKGFYIPTPVGNYSPDWAITFKKDEVKHIFFIAETKGTMDSLELRPIEKAKIQCAKKLFGEISTAEVKYHDVDSYQKLIDILHGID